MIDLDEADEVHDLVDNSVEVDDDEDEGPVGRAVAWVGVVIGGLFCLHSILNCAGVYDWLDRHEQQQQQLEQLGHDIEEMDRSIDRLRRSR